MTATTNGRVTSPTPEQDRKLRRDLGFWSLTGVAFGGIIGSGWLFGAFYGAQAAGPAAVLSWLIAGATLALVALVLVELGAGTPEAGGMVRWPLLANGPLAGTLIAWSMLLAVASTMAAQVSAIAQYANRYLPGLYRDDALTSSSKVLAAGLLLVLVVLNWFGVKLFARLNLLVTGVKVFVPVLTVVALLLSSFHPGNISAGGGLAPYGWTAALSAIAGAGIIYAVDGFAAPIELSAEARDARRDIPRAVLTAIGLSVALYLVLQVAFILAVPTESLDSGWQGLSFASPFGELALLLNLSWLATVIYADAVFSPSGSTYVAVAAGGRETYAAAKNEALPRRFAVVDDRHGVPRYAMALNFATTMPVEMEDVDYRECVLDAEIPPVGHALPGCEVAVLDEDDRPVADGDGEVSIRGHSVMSGYLANPTETAKAFRGGWLRTGDIGRLVAGPTGAPLLTLTGRAKHIAKCGGIGVSLEEIERAARRSSAVKDVCCVTRPHRLLGEALTLFVVAHGGTSDGIGEVRARVGAVANPRRVGLKVVEVDALPRLRSGKADRRKLSVLAADSAGRRTPA